MALDDDDPYWDQHSGKDLHQGIEWQDGDGARAAVFYSAVPASTRLILDFLMDRPGELVNVDVLATQLRERRPGEAATSHRRAVAGSLALIGKPTKVSGRRAPFYWWAGVNGTSTRYAMKPQVAEVFRGAIRASNTDLGHACIAIAPAATPDTAGQEDWTEAEIRAIVDDYLAMLAAESAGQPYSKAQHNRALQAKMNNSRTQGSIEYKHQNISAVMIRLGMPYIRGYKPARNYQGALAQEVQRRMEADPPIFACLHPAAITPPARQTLRPQQEDLRSPSEGRRGRHVDYGLLQEESRRRGALGEELVLAYEQERLRQADCPHLAGKVRWAAREDGDGLGYAILSCDADGSIRHIEVKATAYGPETPFYLSSAELDFARRHQDSYMLYRVFDVLGSPEFYVIGGNVEDKLELTAVTFRAWPLADHTERNDADD